MTAHVDFLKWDSEHFGIKIGACKLSSPFLITEKLIDNARNKEYELIYIFSEKEVADYQYADVKIICEHEARHSDKDFSNVRSYPHNEVSVDLLHLAYESGKHSRFLLDENLADELFKSMYARWIEKSVSKELADDVLVYTIDGKDVGMLAYRWVDSHYADIKLISVNPDYANMGIASTLIAYLDMLSLQRGIASVRTTTQRDNEAACAFYKKNRFKTIQSTFIYHLWISR